MGRGIRQGCPLSPYLSVLCIERLGYIISSKFQDGQWKPIKVGRNDPAILHLIFADDLLLFAEASTSQIMVVKEALDQFCSASGQKVSESKTVMFFSRNVTVRD